MSNNLNRLKKLGDRGLVIAEADHRGDLVYYFLLETDWRRKPVKSEDGPFKALRTAGAVVGQVPKSKGAFIDFEKLKVKVATPEELKEVTREDPEHVSADPNGIVIHLANDQFYSVSPNEWKENRLVDGAEGDAGTLVDRGAIAANIPDDAIPIGTYCVLVNLALLNKTR